MKKLFKTVSLVLTFVVICATFSGCTAESNLARTEIQNRYDGDVAKDAVLHSSIDNWEAFEADDAGNLSVYVVGKLVKCSEELPDEYKNPPDDYNDYFYVTFEGASNNGEEGYRWSTIPIKNPEDQVIDSLKKAEGKPAVILGMGVSYYLSGHVGIDNVQAIIWDDDYVAFDVYEYFLDEEELTAFGSLIGSDGQGYTFPDKSETEEESTADSENNIPAFNGDELSDEYISNVKSAFGGDTALTCQATDDAVIVTISPTNYSDAAVFYAHCAAYGLSPLFDAGDRMVTVGIVFGNNTLSFMRNAGQVTPPYIVTLTLDSSDSMYAELLEGYYSMPMINMYGSVTTK